MLSHQDASYVSCARSCFAELSSTCYLIIDSPCLSRARSRFAKLSAKPSSACNLVRSIRATNHFSPNCQPDAISSGQSEQHHISPNCRPHAISLGQSEQRIMFRRTVVHMLSRWINPHIVLIHAPQERMPPANKHVAITRQTYSPIP